MSNSGNKCPYTSSDAMYETWWAFEHAKQIDLNNKMLERRRDRKSCMEIISWGHKFDYRTRMCECGLSYREYSTRKYFEGDENGNYRCELVGDTELLQMFESATIKKG